jgi:hypothetical protein
MLHKILGQYLGSTGCLKHVSYTKLSVGLLCEWVVKDWYVADMAWQATKCITTQQPLAANMTLAAARPHIRVRESTA